MLLDAGHILVGKTSNRMKVCGFTIHERVHRALRLVSDQKGLGMSYVARGWIQSLVQNHKNLDKALLIRAAEDLPGGCASHIAIPLSNASIRRLNKLKDQWGCKLSGIVNVAVVLGVRQFAQHYAEPELRAEIERALFGERKAEVLEDKEGNSVAAA